jgi:hypothetical protein
MHMNLSTQLEEVELGWYMELGGNGKRVTTRMPGEDMKKGRLIGRNRQLMSHSNIEHGSVFHWTTGTKHVKL